MADAGYNNYYAVLNASDYGIPQHRERVFIVSIRKDIDRDKFAFPQKEPLRLRVKDLLEYEVEEKYYIDTDRARELIRKLAEEGKLPENDARCLRYERTEYAKQIRHDYEAGLTDERRCNLRQWGVRDDGRSNTVTTVQKDNYIVEPNIKALGNLDGHETGRVLDADGITPSLKGTDYKNPVKIALKQVGEIGPHQTDRVYDPDGLSRSLKSTDYTHPVNIVNTEIERLGDMYEVTSKSGKSDDDVFGINGISSALTCKHPFKIVEVKQVGNLYPEAKFNNTQRGRVYDPEGCAPTINTMQGGGLEPKILQVGQLFPEDKIRNSQNGRVYSPEGCCPTMLARQYKDPHKILEVVSDRNGNFTGVVENIDTRCKTVGDLKAGGQKGLVYDTEKSMCTLTATQYKDPHKIVYNHRIRKLTPKECWRLMGFDDEDFEKAKAAGISNTQLYKQAGNSIVVQVLEKLFEKLLEAQKFEVEVK